MRDTKIDDRHWHDLSFPQHEMTVSVLETCFFSDSCIYCTVLRVPSVHSVCGGQRQWERLWEKHCFMKAQLLKSSLSIISISRQAILYDKPFFTGSMVNVFIIYCIRLHLCSTFEKNTQKMCDCTFMVRNCL